MRIAVVISNDLYVRSFLSSGAFDELAHQHDLDWLAADDIANLDAVSGRPGYAGTVAGDARRFNIYAWLRAVLMAGYRFRSRTLAIRTAQLGRRERMRLKTLALPGVRQVVTALALRRLGPNTALRDRLADLRPDLVVAPTAGTDALVLDLVREAKVLGIPSLLLVNGWDNLSSKTTFSVLPDYIAVWGQQSVRHAVRIHGMRPERVFPIGVPTFQRYFSFDPATTPPPYPFPYVVFAGCASPFDERTALRALDDTLNAVGERELKIVYRPHPWRQPRRVDDSVREQDFRHVVIDAQVRNQYLAAVGRPDAVNASEFLPSLDYYPALVGHARFVVCPLSTMTVESGILERRVLVLTYDDAVHPVPPNLIAQFDHFEGIDAIEGFEMVARLEDLGPTFERMLGETVSRSIRAQIRPWLFYDERPYGERLAAVVSSL